MKNKNEAKELPNIYGRKPSRITMLDGTTVAKYDSRRQARKARKKEAEAMGLKNFQLKIIVLEQLPDTKRNTKDGTQQQDSGQKSKSRPKHKGRKGQATVQGNKSRESSGTEPSVSG